MGKGKSGDKRTKSVSSQNYTPQQQQKKLPATGAKTQQDFINHVKNQIKVDLSKARDTQFDDKKGFNINTSKLSRNDLYSLQNYLNKFNGKNGFDAQIDDNGANRLYIRVKRK